MGRKRHICEIESKCIKKVFEYLEKQNRYGKKGQLQISGISKPHLEKITATIFDVSRRTVSRCVESQKGMYDIDFVHTSIKQLCVV